MEAAAGPGRFARVVHPRAWIGGTVAIGEGSMVLGLASATADVRLGRHVLVNPGTSIAHDCVLEDFATLAPAVALADQNPLGVTVRSDRPGLVAALYVGGAWLVLPACLAGCLGLDA